MKIVRMTRWENGPTKAFFDFETNDGIVIKGFRIVEGSKGLFVSVPSTKSNKDGKYYDNIVLPKEMKDQLSEVALSEFQSGSPTGSPLPVNPDEAPF